MMLIHSSTSIAMLLLVCGVYHALWYVRFRDALDDTDFAYANYYGQKAGRAVDRRVFSEAGDFPTFKTILYYLFYWAHFVSKSPVRGPRLLFAVINTAGCLFFSISLYAITGSIPKAWIGTLIYCVLSSAPQLGGLYLQSEFWALTLTSGSLAMVLSGHPAAPFLAGMLMAVNPLTVKPLYILESAALFTMAPSGHAMEILTGFAISALLILALYWKDGFFTWFTYHLKGWKLFNYTLKFSRESANKRRIRNLVTFLPLAGGTFLPLLVPAALNPSPLPSGLWLLLSAGLLIVLVQYRFYRYHFICILPVSILFYSFSSFSILHLLALIPIIYTLSFFFFKNKKALDNRINRKIWHYHTRNCVSRPISEWIQENTGVMDRILVVGSSMQIYVHSDRLSIYPQLFFTPEVISSNPEHERNMKNALANRPPEIIILDQNCLNWNMVEYLTKSRYRLVKAFQFNSEYFPVYRKGGSSAEEKVPANQDLFIECLQADERGHLWNPMPAKLTLDPNPTAHQSFI